jgi:hypothetical protein
MGAALGGSEPAYTRAQKYAPTVREQTSGDSREATGRKIAEHFWGLIPGTAPRISRPFFEACELVE